MEALITAGIGDFLTIESYLSDDFLSKIEKIYLATPRNEEIKNVIKLYSQIKDVQIENVSWNFQLTPSIRDKEHLALVYEASNATLNLDLNKIVDLSISVLFRTSILQNFKGSSLLKNKLASISHQLPEKYIVICPSSTLRAVNSRKDIETSEWENILFHLIQTDRYAVVLGLADPTCEVPNNHRVINLLGKTSFAESVEILKSATGYIGIDSALSVLAAQKFDASQLLIKSCNPILSFTKQYYYFPHTDFDFICNAVYPCRTPPLFVKYPAIQYCTNTPQGWMYINELAYFFTKDIVFQMDFLKVVAKDLQTDKTCAKAQSIIAKKYNKKGKLLDIGITDTAFLTHFKKLGYGFSINTEVKKWLLDKEIFYNPYDSDLSDFSVITFWNSLQSIINPSLILSKVLKGQKVIISTPIIENLSKIYESEHLKMNENLYYWTRESFLWFMNSHGFNLIEEPNIKDVNLNIFVFEKVKDIKVFGFGQTIEY